MSKYKPSSINELKELVKDESINLGEIETSLIRDMSKLFSYPYLRKDWSGIESWDVSNVEDMSGMFMCLETTLDLSKWDTSNVVDMSNMFAYSKFNGDISHWNISRVRDMSFIFFKSTFNQDISRWNLSNVVFKDRVLLGSCIKEEFKPLINIIKEYE